MTTTVHPIQNSRLVAFASMTDQLLLMPTRWVQPMLQRLDRLLFQGDFAANGRRVYEAHNARVRALVPPGKLLEYHVREGWAPLCAFLGRVVPEDVAAAGTPHLNSGAEFVSTYHGLGYQYLAAQGKRLLELSAYAALVVVVTGAAAARRWGIKWYD